MRQPPRITTWMLKHFGSGPDNDTLLGDLAEQYQRNGNAMWYWRQALKAIPVSLFKEIRGHPWIAARALLTGWVISMAFLTISRPALLSLSIAMNSVAGRFFMPSNSTAPCFFCNRAVLDYVDAFYGPLLVGIVCGWLISRLHRNQRTAVVLSFAVSLILVGITIGLRRHIYGQFTIVVVAGFLGILLGGGLLFGKSNNVLSKTE